MRDEYDCDVLVVGAGPTGLCTALMLVQHGVRVRIVDRKPGPVEQARAAIVHARTLEFLDRLGVAEAAVAQGLPITDVAIHESGRHAGDMPLAGEGVAAQTRFPYALALEQFETERLLVEALGEHEVAVAWDSEVQDLIDTGDGVRVRIESEDGPATVTARWLVGADGASSTIRRFLGQEFDGKTYEQAGMLADVTLDVDLGVKGMRLNLTRGGFVGILPLASGRCRLFGVVPPALHQAPAQPGGPSHESYAPLESADLQRWFDDYFKVDARLREVVWASMFRFHSRLASRFRVGNAFLVGDAAHIHNPAGGQGLNLGIGDAVNLAWKLAQVVNGEAPMWLLDTYESERRPIAESVLKRTDLGFKLETANNPMASWMRAHVATRVVGVVSRLPPVRRLFFHMFSQLWITYRGSRAVGSAAGALKPGDRAPYAPIKPTRDGARSILDLTYGAGYHVLVFSADNMDTDELGSQLAARYSASVTTHVIPASEHAAYQAYQADGARLVLVRPDGHIAALAAPCVGGAAHYALGHRAYPTRWPELPIVYGGFSGTPELRGYLLIPCSVAVPTHPPSRRPSQRRPGRQPRRRSEQDALSALPIGALRCRAWPPARRRPAPAFKQASTIRTRRQHVPV
ncbi:FAD-dependent monooxygenase [Amycolatopsis sp. NPDC058986]|uniref:FAD-dependent monooxygenase n=1 Tax=unclassified Amycolatopsis TaxID=2618356 RepID=UPI00366ADB98